MHRSRISPSSRFTQTKVGAWAISKPSTNRISPFNKKEVAELLKASAASRSLLERRQKFILAKNADEEDGFKNHGGYPLRRKSSKIFNSIKARLEKDSRIYNSKLKEIEPTIKSLSLGQAQASPKLRNSRVLPHRFKTPLAPDVNTLISVDKDPLGMGLFPSANTEGHLAGEKLVTVGGYIISLLEVNDKIKSVIRPRVSSDKAGLELEVKIVGCNPLDIKFEKRYDTLIVIGISSSTFRKFEDLKDAEVKHGKSKDEKHMSTFGNTRDFDHDYINRIPFVSDHEYLEDIHEIVNIFVPKNVPLNQIFVSKPDTRGRIFVKGP